MRDKINPDVIAAWIKEELEKAEMERAELDLAEFAESRLVKKSQVGDSPDRDEPPLTAEEKLIADATRAEMILRAMRNAGFHPHGAA